MSERAEIETFGLQTGTDGGIVRRAIISDVPAIMRLLRQVLSVHNASRPDLFKPEGGKYSEKELETIIADGERPVFVFVDAGGEVLGHCFCIIEDYLETGACYPRKTLYIDDLCVDSGARRRHVGRRLYEHVKEFARAAGAYNITLHAWEGNAGAIAFYRSLGLTVQQYTMEEIVTSNDERVVSNEQRVTGNE